MSFDEARAVVRFDPARVAPHALVQAVAQIGFGAEVIDAASRESSDAGQAGRGEGRSAP